MKANEAPEKIYLSPITLEEVKNVITRPTDSRDIEYIRTDAFIEKAVKFFAPYIQDNCGGYDREFVIEKFKNYMKGE